jgi:hypothetical protein
MHASGVSRCISVSFNVVSVRGDETVHYQSSSQYFGLYNWCGVGDGKELNRMEGRDGRGSQRIFVLNMQIKNTADVSL